MAARKFQKIKNRKIGKRKPRRNPISHRATSKIRRDLKTINFSRQHWWQKSVVLDGTLKEKVSLLYEGYRRRDEIRQAWLRASFNQSWQGFAVFVTENLPKSWPELNEIQKSVLLEWVSPPFFSPPAGYSVYPDKTETELCKQWAAQKISIPASDDPDGFIVSSLNFALGSDRVIISLQLMESATTPKGGLR